MRAAGCEILTVRVRVPVVIVKVAVRLITLSLAGTFTLSVPSPLPDSTDKVHQLLEQLAVHRVLEKTRRSLWPICEPKSRLD